MAIRRNTEDVVYVLKQDAKFIRLKDLFGTSPLYSIPLNTLSSEIQAIHATRLVRRLNALDPKIVDSLVNATIHDQANRSRLAEMLVTLVKTRLSLAATVESLKHHLLVTYQDELSQFRTKEERSMILDIALRQFTSYLAKVDRVKAMAEIVISDIDKASWNIRAIIDALKIHAAREVHV